MASVRSVRAPVVRVIEQPDAPQDSLVWRTSLAAPEVCVPARGHRQSLLLSFTAHPSADAC